MPNLDQGTKKLDHSDTFSSIARLYFHYSLSFHKNDVIAGKLHHLPFILITYLMKINYIKEAKGEVLIITYLEFVFSCRHDTLLPLFLFCLASFAVLPIYCIDGLVKVAQTLAEESKLCYFSLPFVILISFWFLSFNYLFFPFSVQNEALLTGFRQESQIEA